MENKQTPKPISSFRFKSKNGFGHLVKYYALVFDDGTVRIIRLYLIPNEFPGEYKYLTKVKTFKDKTIWQDVIWMKYSSLMKISYNVHKSLIQNNIETTKLYE